MLHNKEDRDSITRNASKLSDTDEESVKGLHLDNDLTLDERKADDEKIAEANEKNANSTLLEEVARAPMGITPEEGEEKESPRSMCPDIAKTLHNTTDINNNFKVTP